VAVDKDADALKIGVETALCGPVGMAPVIADCGGFAAAHADLGHVFLGLLAEQSR
jgi:hypothetical protein